MPRYALSKQRWIPAFAGMTRLLSLSEIYRKCIARHPGEGRDPVLQHGTLNHAKKHEILAGNAGFRLHCAPATDTNSVSAHH